MRAIALLILIVACYSLTYEQSQQIQELQYNLKKADKESFVFRFINTIAEIVHEAQIRSQKNGHSLFGFERWIGPLWQNPISCAQCQLKVKGVDFLL